MKSNHLKSKIIDYKNCLKATQLQNKINQLKKNLANTESCRENHYEFLRKEKIQKLKTMLLLKKML